MARDSVHSIINNVAGVTAKICKPQRSGAGMILLVLLAIIFITSTNSAHAASGSISFKNYSSPLEVSKNFAVEGTYILTEDTTRFQEGGPFPRRVYAVARYKIDDVDVPNISVDITDLQKGRTTDFSMPVDITNLDPSKVHTATVYLVDIYGYQLYGWQLDDFWGEAGTITSKSTKFRIVVPQSCELRRTTGSTVNVNTGNLADQLELFSIKGSSLLSGFTLFYNSIDTFTSAIGSGWNHSFETSLLANIDGTMLLREPSGNRRVYNAIPNSTDYISQAGDSSVLRKDAASYTISEADGSRMVFNATGMMIYQYDRFGNALSYAYNADKDLVSVSDGNRAITFGYDTSVIPHRLLTVTDANQNNYTLQYNAEKRLTNIVYPATDSGTASWHYTYNADGYLETKRDPGNNITRYAYAGDKVVAVFDPQWTEGSQGHSRTIDYPTDDYATTNTTLRTSTFTEKDGGGWMDTYDILTGRVLLRINPAGGVTDYTYYADNRRRSKTEPAMNGIRLTTFYSYDSKGNTATESVPMDCAAANIDPATINITDNRIKTAYRYEYNDSLNRITSQTDERDSAHPLTTTYAYTTDGNGYLTTTTTDPATAVTVTRQYPDGLTRDVTDATGKTTSYSYRSDKQIDTITAPDGTSTAFTGYDANGNNTEMKIKDADGTIRKTIAMTYDARNRLKTSTTTVTGETPVTTTYGYDANDNRTTIIDPENNETRTEYNYNHQATKTSQYLKQDATSKEIITSYQYGATGCPSCGGGVDKLTAVIDAKQQKTEYQYDTLGRLQYETDPLGKKYHYTYYENGKLKQKYDATSTTEILLITYSYDPVNGQLTGKQYADGTGETYTYDPNDRIKTASNQNISYTYEYYSNGRLKSITDSNGKSISYDEYTAAGQRQKVTVKDGSEQRSISYTYDDANRPWQIISNSGTFEYLYDELGRRDSITYPNGITADYYYDELDRLTSLIHAMSSSTIAFADYSDFDKTGNRKAKTTDKGSETYRYDSLYRLTTVTGNKPETFSYDDVGNRTAGPGAKDISYSYNAGNQMIQGRKLQYGYDNAGNQVSRVVPAATDKTWALTWSTDNRLIKMEKSKGTSEKETVIFKYDPFGKRIGKQYTTIIDGVPKQSTWTYVYDNDNIALEIYTDENNSTEKTWYTHGVGVDEHLAMERNGNNFYFHQDGLGSVISITNASAAVVQTYEYDSFGMPTPSTGFRNSYTYTGREWDREIGLHFNRARYYDPMEGRFVQKDPITIFGNIYNNKYYITKNQHVKSILNSYTYTDNNPIRYNDPYGLFGWDTIASKLGPWLLEKVIKKLGSKFLEDIVNKIIGDPQAALNSGADYENRFVTVISA